MHFTMALHIFSYFLWFQRGGPLGAEACQCGEWTQGHLKVGELWTVLICELNLREETLPLWFDYLPEQMSKINPGITEPPPGFTLEEKWWLHRRIQLWLHAAVITVVYNWILLTAENTWAAVCDRDLTNPSGWELNCYWKLRCRVGTFMSPIISCACKCPSDSWNGISVPRVKRGLSTFCDCKAHFWLLKHLWGTPLPQFSITTGHYQSKHVVLLCALEL